MCKQTMNECDPGETPTPNLLIRSQLFFAVELQGQSFEKGDYGLDNHLSEGD